MGQTGSTTDRGREDMRLFGRRFVNPFLLKTSVGERCGVHFGGAPDLAFRFRRMRMGGSMTSTSYIFEIQRGDNQKRQFVFCWRPDVTRYWWGEKG